MEHPKIEPQNGELRDPKLPVIRGGSHENRAEGLLRPAPIPRPGVEG